MIHESVLFGGCHFFPPQPFKHQNLEGIVTLATYLEEGELKECPKALKMLV